MTKVRHCQYFSISIGLCCLDFHAGQNDTHINIITVMCESAWSSSYLVTDSALVISSLIKSWRTKIRGSHWLGRPRTFRRANGGRLSEKGMRIGFNRRGRRHGKSYANKKPSGGHNSLPTRYTGKNENYPNLFGVVFVR